MITEIDKRLKAIRERKGNMEVNTGESTWLKYAIECFTPVSPYFTQFMGNQVALLEEQMKIAFSAYSVSVDFILLGGLANNTLTSPYDAVDIMLVFNGKESATEQDEENAMGIADMVWFEHTTITILKNLYPEVQLECNQALSLNLKFVPSTLNQVCNLNFYLGTKHHHANSTSGFSNSAYDVQLYNRWTNSFFFTNPNLVKRNLENKNNRCEGNLFGLIRYLKHLKEDASQPIELDGFFISSLVYRMELYALTQPVGQILYLAMECGLFLKKVAEDPFVRREILAPDNNLLCFLKADKVFVSEVLKLKNEIDRSIRHLIMEIDLFTKVDLTINH